MSKYLKSPLSENKNTFRSVLSIVTKDLSLKFFENREYDDFYNIMRSEEGIIYDTILLKNDPFGFSGILVFES
jgi:hypothetical protein